MAQHQADIQKLQIKSEKAVSTFTKVEQELRDHNEKLLAIVERVGEEMDELAKIRQDASKQIMANEETIKRLANLTRGV